VWTVQLAHLGGSAGGVSWSWLLCLGLRKCEERSSSSSSPGYGTYSCGMVERSAMVLATE
jgi:hypothetical protein